MKAFQSDIFHSSCDHEHSLMNTHSHSSEITSTSLASRGVGPVTTQAPQEAAGLAQKPSVIVYHHRSGTAAMEKSLGACVCTCMYKYTETVYLILRIPMS